MPIAARRGGCVSACNVPMGDMGDTCRCHFTERCSERTSEINAATGVYDDCHLEAGTAAIERRVKHTEIRGEPRQEEPLETTLVHIASESSRRAAVILTKRRVGIDRRAEPFAQHKLGAREMQPRMEGRSRRVLDAMIRPQGLSTARVLDRAEWTVTSMGTGKGLMIARMPVLRQHHVSEAFASCVDDRHDLIAVWHGECSAVAEVVLDIDNDQNVAIAYSTHYRWKASRDSMLHEQHSEGGADHRDGGGAGRAGGLGALGQERSPHAAAGGDRPAGGAGHGDAGDRASRGLYDRDGEQVARALRGASHGRAGRDGRSRRRAQIRRRDERRILAVLDGPPPSGHGRWTAPLIAAALGDAHEQYVWRFLRAQKIDLAGRKSWCVSEDPEFAAKAAEIVGLYLDPPAGALVIAIDEKPHIQALERAQGYLKLPNGRALTGRAHHYTRHGTSTLFAALDIAKARSWRAITSAGAASSSSIL